MLGAVEGREGDFFYKYKKISISSGNMHKLNKTDDQIRQDHAVMHFFRKRHQGLTEL